MPQHLVPQPASSAQLTRTLRHVLSLSHSLMHFLADSCTHSLTRTCTLTHSQCQPAPAIPARAAHEPSFFSPTPSLTLFPLTLSNALSLAHSLGELKGVEHVLHFLPCPSLTPLHALSLPHSLGELQGVEHVLHSHHAVDVLSGLRQAQLRGKHQRLLHLHAHRRTASHSRSMAGDETRGHRVTSVSFTCIDTHRHIQQQGMRSNGVS